MIKKIFLKSFGRFQGQGFDCERTTVFHGPNESGKTTLFDAIFKVLCRPSKSTAEGKRLEERYGQGEAEVTFAGEPLAPDRRDFLYLHAIRAGDVTFGDQWTAKWRNGLESQVLTAGVDVEAAAVSLESLASHGPPESSAALDRLRAEQAQKQRALDELVAKREVLLGAGSRSSELDTRVQDAKERLELHQQTVRKLADDLERDTEARRRQTLQSELEAVQRRLLQIEQQENLGAFTEDRSGELAALEEAIATAQKEQAVARSKRDESEKQRATANSLVQKLEAQLDETMTRADQATLAQRKLEEARDQTVTRTVWRPDMLFAALAAAAACAVAWFAIGDNVGMGMALVGALAALGFTITAKHTFEEDDREEQTRICQREQAKWNAKAPEGMRTTADTLDGLKSFFARQSVTVKTVEEEIAHARREAKELADKLLKAEDGLRARTEAVQVAQDKLQQWLDDLGIKTKHEYASRRAQLEALAKDRGDEASSLSDSTAAQARLQEALAEVPSRELAAHPRDDDSRGRLVREHEQAQRMLSRTEDEYRRLQLESEKVRGAEEATLADLPEALDRLETDLRRLARQIEQQERERAAAALAADILRSSHADAQQQLGSLSGQISAYLKVGLGQEASVIMNDLTPDGVEVRDATGTVRPVKHLSSGTRDLVVLAARLALAHKTGRIPLLVLDEPFLHFDGTRQEQALNMLSHFQKRTGWQIVLFTRDPDLAHKAGHTLSLPVLHQLT